MFMTQGQHNTPSAFSQRIIDEYYSDIVLDQYEYVCCRLLRNSFIFKIVSPGFVNFLAWASLEFETNQHKWNIDDM